MGDDTSSDNRETVTDRDLLDTFRQTESPVITTSEIAEAKEIPISQGQVLKRLKSLEEKGQVISKSFSAKPQIRLWWHKRLEMKEAWTSENEFSEDIGVEAVDMLDLPGSGEKLRKRREAVNAVFKFLFDVETASKNELSLVGWGADMETYADSDSLWNNCLNRALKQSPLFVLNKTEKRWSLANLGSNFKDIDNRPLWEDWDENKTKIDNRYHQTVWASLFEFDFPVEFLIQGHVSWTQYEFGERGIIIGYVLEMDGPVWNTPTGRFDVFLEVQENPEDLEVVLDKIDHLTSNLGTDFSVKKLIDDESVLQIKCSYQLAIDASTVLRQRNEATYDSNDLIQPLKKIHKWEEETREQLFRVDERVKHLLEQV